MDAENRGKTAPRPDGVPYLGTPVGLGSEELGR